MIAREKKRKKWVMRIIGQICDKVMMLQASLKGNKKNNLLS